MIRKTNPKVPYSLNDFPKVLPEVKFFTKEPINKELKAFVGWDGMVVFDSSLDVLQVLKIYAKQYQNYAQSCGRCTPGKYGGKVIYELLEKIHNHNYQSDSEAINDIEKLQEVCELMKTTSKCEVGKTTPNPILQILKENLEVFAKALPLSRKKIQNIAHKEEQKIGQKVATQDLSTKDSEQNLMQKSEQSVNVQDLNMDTLNAKSLNTQDFYARSLGQKSSMISQLKNDVSHEVLEDSNKLCYLSQELQQSMQKFKEANAFAHKIQQSIESGASVETILQEARQRLESMKLAQEKEDLRKRLIDKAQMLAIIKTREIEEKNGSDDKMLDKNCSNLSYFVQNDENNLDKNLQDSKDSKRWVVATKDSIINSAMSSFETKHTGADFIGDSIIKDSSKISQAIKKSCENAKNCNDKEYKEYKEYTLSPVNHGIVRKSNETSLFEPLEKYKSAITTHVGGLSYISKITAPCTDECPSRVDIPAYIEGVKDMRYLSSLGSTRASMPLAQVCGRVCPHPCENACRRAALDSPISIMELKRIGANAEFNLKQTSNWQGYVHPNNIESKSALSTKSVGVIGAGPAGLSSAYYMSLRGIRVEVYEALPVLGGEVAVGVPNYRMPIIAYNHDIESLKSLGVIFHTNFLVDSVNILELEKKHDALVIAVGTRASKKLGCKNENVGLEGYLPAIKFMDSVNLAQKFNIGELPNLAGKRVVCVGGGFTSMDVVRCCVRLGAASVIMLYRRDEETIIKNTSAEEYHEACEEGVKFQFLSAVSEIVEKDSRIFALKINRYELIKNDDSPKGELKLVDDSGVIECDILIPAVSQEMDFVLDSGFGVELSKWNTISTDGASFSTTRKGVFAAGDCVSGPLTIVNAVGHGRRVASVIANYLQTGEVSINDDEKMEDLLKSIGVFDKNREVKGFLSGNKREVSDKLNAKYRANNFEEVNLGFTNEAAITEAQRCMRCYYISMCVIGNDFKNLGESQ